ncbi:hypothetical protein MASR2M44_07820 [Bacteroidota bacterium]
MDGIAAGLAPIYLKFPAKHRERLYQLASCKGLQLALDADWIWLKGFALDDMNNHQINSLPHRTWYQEYQGKLLEPGKRLFDALPSNLAFEPLENVLDLELQIQIQEPSQHDFQVINNLVPTETIQPSCALLLDKKQLEKALREFTEIRFSKLTGIQINNQFLLVGQPLLPLPGKSYWQYHDLLIPAGYTFRWTFLMDKLSKKCSLNGKNLALFEPSGNWIAIPKSDLKPLHRGIMCMELKW